MRQLLSCCFLLLTASGATAGELLCQPKLERTVKGANLETLTTDLKACARELAGAPSWEALAHYRLSAQDAVQIQKAYQAATSKETWDFPQLFSLEYLPGLARIGAALSLHVIGDRVSFDVAHNAARRREMTALAAGSLEYCQQLLKATVVRSDGTHEVAETRDALTCLLRDSGDLWKIPLLRQWPGSRCADGRGTSLGSVCLDGYTKDGFAEKAVDRRLPAALEKFIRTLNGKIEPGLKIAEIGVNGCLSLRFETSARVKRLRDGDELLSGYISNHSRATACDLRFFIFEKTDASRLRFDLAPKGQAAGIFPFLEALQKSLLSAQEFAERSRGWETRRNTMVAERGGEERIFRELEKNLTPNSDPELRTGVVIRNTLVDAGFQVLTPLTNANHNSHFHANLPDDQR